MTAAAHRPAARVPLVEPLDPDSDKGREVAARLSRTLADVEAAIAARKARAAAAAQVANDRTT